MTKKFWYVEIGGLPQPGVNPTVFEVEMQEVEPGWWVGLASAPYQLRGRPVGVGLHIHETRQAAINYHVEQFEREKKIIEERISILKNL